MDAQPGVVLYRRWRILPEANLGDVVALASGEIVAHYGRLSDDVVLALEVVDERTVLAIQRWTTRGALQEAMHGTTHDEWWQGYQDTLTRWNALAELMDEWATEVVF